MVAPATAAYADTGPSQPLTQQLAEPSQQLAHPALPVSGLYVRYQDDNTGLCLDGNYAGSSYTNPCYGGGDTFQDWAYEITQYNAVTLGSQQTGRCLDSNYAGNVYTSLCDGNDTFQNWSFGSQGTGFTIQNYQTGLCLDSNANENDYTDPCNWNNSYQNWTPLF
jgi:hypothetical protein